eukprot:12759965-Alexandrium_andersonii.AAC.1
MAASRGPRPRSLTRPFACALAGLPCGRSPRTSNGRGWQGRRSAGRLAAPMPRAHLRIASFATTVL